MRLYAIRNYAKETRNQIMRLASHEIISKKKGGL